ncbi:stearoyl-CoA desaturase 5-like [Limulus polyphemus]|uniref:Stearoyl-CoA desaturase 5-like n=1 Tax=Limulus polyphemus TaxID=6850 RepID=A0ABM1BY90_LIMPO|nr:stearoyl-CoA desaturase 5-like [Limulus polyphemus]
MAPRQTSVTAGAMIPLTKTKVTSNTLPIVWRNVIIFGILHIIAIFGARIAIFELPLGLWLFGLFYGLLSGLGVTAGAHRLWSHRTYKAKWSLRLFLAFCNCIAGQNDIYEWSRDHRVHHKFSETDADPHNVNRGFFFAHMGWLLKKKHPDVIKKGKTIDCGDILRDPVVQFQRR